MTPVDELVRVAVAARGPLPFSEVMELALYDDDSGFYATTGRAGRRGDFLTSPEVGPLFGAVVARALDAWWQAAGSPPHWTVVDAGAGPGTLARAVLAARPACADALRYVLVERATSQRARHAGIGERAGATAGRGIRSQDALPAAGPGRPGRATDAPVVVLANELLDNLPLDLYELTSAGASSAGASSWAEVRVGVDPADGSLVEVLHRELSPEARRVLATVTPAAGSARAAHAHRVPASEHETATGLPIGARIPLQRAAQGWLADALALADAGGPGSRVVVIDYAATTLELAARPATGPTSWLRTYRGHDPGRPPLEALGTQDITCEVAVDQLALVRPPTTSTVQADWLRAHGIDELVEEGRRTWHERAHLGDLEAVRARSRITEAEALLDPTGLGAFTVLEWEVRA